MATPPEQPAGRYRRHGSLRTIVQPPDGPARGSLSFRAAMIALLVTQPASAWQWDREAGKTAGGRLWAPQRRYLFSNILIIGSPRRSPVRTKPSSNVSITWGARHHEPRILGAGVLRSHGRE